MREYTPLLKRVVKAEGAPRAAFPGAATRVTRTARFLTCAQLVCSNCMHTTHISKKTEQVSGKHHNLPYLREQRQHTNAAKLSIALWHACFGWDMRRTYVKNA